MPAVPAPNRTAPRHHAARTPAIAGASPRRTVANTTAAVGAAVGVVATGAFAVVVPTPLDGTSTTADAAEGIGPAALAANATTLAPSQGGAHAASGGYLTPVAFITGADNTTNDPPAGQDPSLASLDKAGKLADQIAAMHAQAAQEQAAQDRLNAVIATGGIDGWIAEALNIMDLPQSLAPGVKKIIMAESGGNPRAINNWDANAQRGTPSQGLMQVIPSTFRAYVAPSLAGRPITDPVANITAGVRYMIANYGIATVKAGGRSNGAGSYIGY
ncbi:transglycosylase SLT domain-containing protein [Pseudonocardia acidicola]|uniref:Transglycosylase SLT domain-containing protein n=1 Tax=Pseudonocardia acidicola TaxID=2724939 RepID=A0ABX1SA30_9PSEU|nr:transglycosylase SLT domain-containing protein [Pseudonocardia acidicola]